tara:strand:+ start:171 stop:542 length:372 start_codon:yes stop_codon:yes gene_type:complete
MSNDLKKTKWNFPQCIVCSRDLEDLVEDFSNRLASEYEIRGVDWCGSRVVMLYQLKNDTSKAIDIPEHLFERCKAFVSRRRSLKKRLFIRREDPGLGIYIPEIDRPVAEAGGVPDGFIQLSKG